MKHIYAAALLWLWLLPLSAQSIRLTLPEVVVPDGETVTLPLTVADFDSIVSLQVSINWDTGVAAYQGSMLADLPLLAIGDFQAAQGELRLSWFDTEGDGLSLPDGTVIAQLTFQAMGSPGDFTFLTFTGTPLAIQIFRATATPGQFVPVELQQDRGRIAIEAPLGLTFDAQSVTCFGSNDGQINVEVAADPTGYTFDWVGPDGFTAQGLELSGLAPGDYTLTVRDPDGATVLTSPLTIAGPAAPLAVAMLTVTDAACDTPTGSVAASAQGGTPAYTFALDDRQSADGNFADVPAGTYTLVVTDANGCTVSDAVEVVAPDAPAISLPDTVQLCGDPVVLDPGGVGESYRWSSGDTTSTLTVAQTGMYSVSVTNAAGCTAEAAVDVVPGLPPVAVLDTDFPEICPGDTLQLNVQGGDTYRWLQGRLLLSDVTVPDPLAFPDVTTTFAVDVSNACGSDTLVFEILVLETLATAGADTCIAPGDKALLRASGGIFYAWAPNAYPVSDPTIGNPTASPEVTTVYEVRITDINGCMTTDAVEVSVADNPLDGILPYDFISPNGDGFNDVLEFGNLNKYGANSLKVYNRWGDLVYQKLNYESDEQRFDGMYNGQPLPAGNYFYVLAFRQGEIKQTLTIVWE